MSTMRKFALVYGVVFLAAGLAGFIPGLLAPHTNPDVHVTAGMGLLLGLFAVNVLHDAAHLLFGVYGLVASRSDPASRLYAQVVAVGYALLTVMGLVTPMNMHTFFGLIPIYGHDVWLHALLAIPAAYFGFMRPVETARLRA